MAEGGGAHNASTQQIDYVLDANQVPVDDAMGDPVANLALIRSIFFPHPGLTLGAHKRPVFSQAFSVSPGSPSSAGSAGSA